MRNTSWVVRHGAVAADLLAVDALLVRPGTRLLKDGRRGTVAVVHRHEIDHGDGSVEFHRALDHIHGEVCHASRRCRQSVVEVQTGVRGGEGGERLAAAVD